MEGSLGKSTEIGSSMGNNGLTLTTHFVLGILAGCRKMELAASHGTGHKTGDKGHKLWRN